MLTKQIKMEKKNNEVLNNFYFWREIVNRTFLFWKREKKCRFEK